MFSVLPGSRRIYLLFCMIIRAENPGGGGEKFRQLNMKLGFAKLLIAPISCPTIGNTKFMGRAFSFFIFTVFL